MFKKKHFKHNKNYLGIKDKSSFHFLDVAVTFFLSCKNLILKKNSKNYFSKTSVKDWFCYSKPIDSSIKPIVTWIGHSTFLIQIGGVNILTDPIFEDLLFLYSRNIVPGVALHELPKIDFILISHNHHDHMDKKCLLFLKKFNPTILVPLGDKKWFTRQGFENVFEKDWWQDEIFGPIKISFLPAIHWSGQGLWDINKSLWGSFMIEYEGFKIYFAGDSAYSTHFIDIARNFAPIDLALMPIGPNEPRRFVKSAHLNAKEAIQAFIDLKAKIFIPMHWGTFRMGQDRFDEPIYKLKDHWKNAQNFLKDKNLFILKFGEQFKFDFATHSHQAKQQCDCELY